MKNSMKNLLIMAIACFLASCLKTDDNILDYRGITPLVMNPKSNFPSRAVFATKAVDSAFGVTTLNLMAKYSFQIAAPRDIKITFTRDDALIAKYNQTFGTSYLPLPADSYEMTSNQLIIPTGSQEAILPVNVIPAKISGNNNYIIAFSITNADGINIVENFKSIVYTLKGNNNVTPPVILPPTGPGLPPGGGLTPGISLP